MERLILLLFISLLSSATRGAEIDYAKRLSASEMSEWFFGKATPAPKRKRMALNVGRINLRVGTSLKCGKLSLAANLSAELKNLKQQLGAAAEQLKGMLSGGGILIATICYYKPTLCAHIRHFTAQLREELNMQMDSCRAIDAFIDAQVDKGRRQLHAEAVQQCIAGNDGDMGASQMRACLQEKGQARNLLQPFTRKLAQGKQRVLASLMQVVQQSDDYKVLAQLLGEVELRRDGYWTKAFPENLLKPADYVHGINRTMRLTVCSPAVLRVLITDKNYQKQKDGMQKYLHQVIQEKISANTIRDLESLPRADRARACRALALSLAQLAIKRFTAHGKSTMTAALANDALPDALAAFYSERSEMTFAAIDAKMAANEIKPISAVLTKIGQLGHHYRQRNREVAAGVTARKILNKELENACTDAFSCSE